MTVEQVLDSTADVETTLTAPASPRLILLVSGTTGQATSDHRMITFNNQGCDIPGGNTATFLTGFDVVFAIDYIFNLQYEEQAVCTGEFIQKHFIGINPERGTKAVWSKVVSEKTGAIVQKNSAPVNTYDLTDFEWDVNIAVHRCFVKTVLNTMLVSQLLLPVYIFTFLIGLPANILAFYTFCRKVHRKPAPIDILLLNLTISDLIFLTFLPFKMKEAVDDMIWKMPDYLCPLSSFMFFSTIYTSTFFLTGVSIERYLGVAFPIQYAVYRRPCYAVIASLFFWLVGTLNLSIVYIVPSLPSKNSNDCHSVNCSMLQPSEMKCYNNFTHEQLSILLPVRLELFVVLFCIPFLICGFCYINLIQILSRLPHISRRRRLRAIGLALGTLVVFAVCFGPYNASHVVGFVRAESEDWRELALISSTLNACLDPIIFYFSSAAVRSAISDFRKGIKEKFHELNCKKIRCCPMLDSETEKYRETPPPDNQSHSLGQLELAGAPSI